MPLKHVCQISAHVDQWIFLGNVLNFASYTVTKILLLGRLRTFLSNTTTGPNELKFGIHALEALINMPFKMPS